MRNDFYKDYVRQYSISKTLRFELRPQGRTQEYIEKHGILDEDEARAESYAKVKKVIDEYHKQFMPMSFPAYSTGPDRLSRKRTGS